MKAQKITSIGLGVLMASLGLKTLADDTDIYKNLDALKAQGVRPNVLLVLDTSKSMDRGVDGDWTPAAGSSRIDLMRSVLKGIVNDTNLHGKVNIGLGRYNSTAGSIIYPVVELTPANATILAGRIDNHMTPAGTTPLVPSFYESALYMLGMDVDGGNAREDVGGEDEGWTAEEHLFLYGKKENSRISHELALADGTWNSGVGACTSKDSDSKHCVSETWSSEATYQSPITHQCQPNHIVLLTDGEANSNEAKEEIADLIGTACTDVGTDGRENLECSIDLAKYLHTTDLFNDNAKFGVNGSAEAKQTISTHTIAFAISYPELEKIATAGGGQYFPAQSASQLTSAFTSLFESFVDTEATFSAPSATINQFNRLNHLDTIYFAVFKPDNKVMWPGNIKKYKLATGLLDGGTPQDTTDDLEVDGNTIVDRYGRPAVHEDEGFFLNTSIDFWSSRTLSEVQQAIEAGESVEFSVGEGGAANQITGTAPVYTWIGGSRSTVTAANGALSKDVLNVDESEVTKVRSWIAGADVADWDGDENITEPRKQMGDPLHSRPVVVTYGRKNEVKDPDTDELISFDPDVVMFFGTNDGYFRAIDADSGRDYFSFVPEEMLGGMDARMRNPVGDHAYGVDGAPTVWIHDENGNGIIETTGGNDDHVYAYFGFRRGGTSYYALDVTDLNNPQVLWRIQKSGDFAELGQTWSKPVKTKILYDRDDKKNSYAPDELDVLIFAGGYDPDQDNITTNIHRRTDDQGRAIYVVDAKTGRLLWKADPTSHPAMKYSIPATPAVTDPDLSGHADQIYVGDMGGQIWRFDINNSAYWNDGAANADAMPTNRLPSSFITGQTVADFAVDGNDAGSRRFFQSPDVAIIKEKINDEWVQKVAVTIGSGYRARPNVKGVQDRFYMLKLPNPYPAPGTFTAVTDANLLPVTSDMTPTFTTSHYGWYIDMKLANGEKVLSTPLTVDGKVIFTTYEPTARLVGCTAQPGISREYLVKLIDGSPAIDVNGDGTLTEDDRSVELDTGTIVDEPVIIFTEHGGGTTFLGTEQGTYSIDNNRATRTFWYEKE
jgi:type IV pilus assembly protein PilY1